MRLTADMFDFEKYEYSAGELSAGEEYINMVTGEWSRAVHFDCGTRITRVPKAPPRYILLNEGEKLQKGDEFFAYDGIHPRMWHEMPGRTNDVQKREVWRRKVQE